MSFGSSKNLQVRPGQVGRAEIRLWDFGPLSFHRDTNKYPKVSVPAGVKAMSPGICRDPDSMNQPHVVREAQIQDERWESRF